MALTNVDEETDGRKSRTQYTFASDVEPNYRTTEPKPKEPGAPPSNLLVIQQPKSRLAMSRLRAALTTASSPPSGTTGPTAARLSAGTAAAVCAQGGAGGPQRRLQLVCEDGCVVSAPLGVAPALVPRRSQAAPPPPQAQPVSVKPAPAGEDSDAAPAASAAPAAAVSGSPSTGRRSEPPEWLAEVTDGERRANPSDVVTNVTEVDTVGAGATINGVNVVDAVAVGDGELGRQLLLDADEVVVEAAAAAPAVSHVLFDARGGAVSALLPAGADSAAAGGRQQVVLAVDGNVIGTADSTDGGQIVLQVDEESDSVTLLVDRLEDGAVYNLSGGAGGGGGVPADGELLELWERGSAGSAADRPIETVCEVSLVDIRAVCEQCGCAISHHMVGLLARQDGSEYGYRCRICQSVQTDVDEMARHMDSHRPMADSQCRFCSRGLRTFRPATVRRYTCHACQLVFGSRLEMIRHRETHPPHRRFPCELCDKAFQMKVQLEVHMRTHLGHKPYSCDMCPATFTQPSHLINHRRTHTGERPYSCTTCGRSFVQQGHLRAHERTHTGERPYICEICDRGFRQSGQLTAHKKLHEGDAPIKMRRRHGDPISEEDVTCRECRKRFKAPKDLQRHLVVHSAGAFKCGTCERLFKRLDHLKRHRKQHAKPPKQSATRRRRAPRPANGDDARDLSILDEVIDAVLETPSGEAAVDVQLDRDTVDVEVMEAEEIVDDPGDDPGVSKSPGDALWSQVDRGGLVRWRRVDGQPDHRSDGVGAADRRSRLLPAPHGDDSADEEMAMLEAALRDRAAPGKSRRARGGGGPTAAARRRPPPEPSVKLEPVDWDNWDLAADDPPVKAADGLGGGDDWAGGGHQRAPSEDGAPLTLSAHRPDQWTALGAVDDPVDGRERRRQHSPAKHAPPRISRRSTAGNWAASVGVSLKRAPATRGRR